MVSRYIVTIDHGEGDEDGIADELRDLLKMELNEWSYYAKDVSVYQIGSLPSSEESD
jgi:hypothetical protein